MSCSSRESKIKFLLNKAVDYSFTMKIDSAEYCYQKALEIDRNSFSVITSYTSFLINEKRYEKALNILESLPPFEKKSEIYISQKGMILEYQGKLEKALSLYKIHFELNDFKEPTKSSDILKYTGYLTLETLSGKSELALKKCNDLLSKNWISYTDSMALIPLRNEIEYYDGNGFLSFLSADSLEIDFCIPTADIDELKKVYHINFKSEMKYDDYTRVSVNKKFKKPLEILHYKRCE